MSPNIRKHSLFLPHTREHKSQHAKQRSIERCILRAIVAVIRHEGKEVDHTFLAISQCFSQFFHRPSPQLTTDPLKCHQNPFGRS